MAEAKAADERLRGFLRKAGRSADTAKPHGYGSTSGLGGYEEVDDQERVEDPEVCMQSAHTCV